jgi:hypothetical protein
MKQLILSVAVLAALVTGPDTPARAAKDNKDRPEFPIGVCLVQENGYIPELNSWKSTRIGEMGDHIERVGNQWRKLAPSLEKLITPRLVRRLSRRGSKRMTAYKKVPPLANVKFRPVRVNKEQRKIVFEGTIDRLPGNSLNRSHRLKVYLLTDDSANTIIRTTITIEWLHQRA